MKIKVTQEHIDNGDQRSLDSCPVALALCESLGYDHEPLSVSEEEIEYSGTVISQLTGKLRKVSKFIQDFDAGKKVRPFTFEL